VKVFCTYCSASKDPADGKIPAFKRYISPRIVLVQELAEKADAHFCILSGKFGLVDWNEPIPWYDHLLIREEVLSLVEIVVNQIRNKDISEIEYYTRSPSLDLNIIPYMNTIEKATRICGCGMHVFTLEEPRISATIRNWKLIMEMAAEARQKMITNKKVGEQEFIKLLSIFPDDGMVFFQRASGYEKLNEIDLAKRDYENAKMLFPLDRWQWEAQEAINRLDENTSEHGTINESIKRLKNLDNIDLALINDIEATVKKTSKEPTLVAFELRKFLEHLIKDVLIENKFDSFNLDKDIETINNAHLVPAIIINHMHTVRIIGNRAAHYEKNAPLLHSTDVYPSISAFLAILEWFNAN
jgi:hypothetical protein